MQLVQRDEWNNRTTKDSLSLPDIPEAELFQCGTGSYAAPVEVHGWQWSTTFGRWSALCTFADGWHGFTYPKTWS